MLPTRIKFFLNRLLQLALLGAAIFLIYDLFKPMSNILKDTDVFGTHELTVEEVFKELDNLDLNNKSFLEINPIKVTEKLIEHPLIDDAKIRRYLYPSHRMKVYVEEALPWALYGSKIVDRRGIVLADLNDMTLDWQIKKHFVDMKSRLIPIKSSPSLDAKNLNMLRELSLIIEDATESNVTKIVGDREENFCIVTEAQEFKIGLLGEEVRKRVKRVTLIADQLIGMKETLSYVDLSLSTPEIILGKKSKSKARVVSKPKVVKAKAVATKKSKILDAKLKPKKEYYIKEDLQVKIKESKLDEYRLDTSKYKAKPKKAEAPAETVDNKEVDEE